MKYLSAGRSAILFVGLAFLLYGCASPRPAIDRAVPEGFPHHPLDEILLNLQASGDTLYTYEARAAVSLRSPDRGGQFSAEMEARRDDSLFVSISPGLGIEAARALITPDSFYFYDRLKNRLVYGSLDEAGSLLPQPFTSANLFENLLGLIVPPADTHWEVSSDTAFYYLRESSGTMHYVIDPAFWRVIKYEERSLSGELIERRSFSEFDEFGGAVLPRRILFERPADDQTASIYYRNLKPNTDELDFDLRVRDSAERVPAEN